MPSSRYGQPEDSPEHQLRSFIDTIAREALARPHFPHMWLREIADGGRHVDASVIAEFRRVLATLGAILADGQRTADFVKADPFIVQISIVAPLDVFCRVRAPPGTGGEADTAQAAGAQPGRRHSVRSGVSAVGAFQ